jgi:hypothetical protein
VKNAYNILGDEGHLRENTWLDHNIKTNLNSIAADYANWIPLHQNWNERSVHEKKKHVFWFLTKRGISLLFQ